MTNHPLTDEIIEEIAEDVFYYEYSIPIFRQDMRTAYDKGRDDQLKDDMDWLKENLGEWLKAMRPTKTQEDDNA